MNNNKQTIIDWLISQLQKAQDFHRVLNQTPLDFFYDAAFQNECDIYNEPTLFLQP